MEDNEGPLKIGDYITLKNLRLDSFLSAEGILSDDIIMSQSLKSFEDSIFSIHCMRQYSASRELEEFLVTYEVDIYNISDSNTSKFLSALQRGRDNETRLNESYMKQKTGTTICFGEVIQLFHVKSGKYLTVIPDQLARDERENIRIGLSPEGSPFSWLQLMPRYKIDREGDPILSNAEIYLNVSERPNEYIHCADKLPPNNCFHEVNCSLESSSWKLGLYQNVKDSLDKSVLLCSQVIYLHDPETRSNLSITTAKRKSYSVAVTPVHRNNNSNNNNNNNNTKFYDFEHDNDSENNQDYKQDNNNDDDKQQQHQEHHHHHFIDEDDRSLSMASTAPSLSELTDIVIKPLSSSQKGEIDTNSLWVIESKKIISGGPITWKTDVIRFRHLNTGCYLSMEQEYITDSDGNTFLFGMLSTTPSTNNTTTLFNLIELNSTTTYLSVGRALQISQNGLWFTRGDITDSDGNEYCNGSRDRNSAMNFLIYRYKEGQGIDWNTNISTSSTSLTNTSNNNSNNNNNNSNGNNNNNGNTTNGQGSTTANNNVLPTNLPNPNGVQGNVAGKTSVGVSSSSTSSSSTNSNSSNKVRLSQPFDVFVGVAARNYLDDIFTRTIIPPESDLQCNTIWPGFEHTELQRFDNIITDIIHFTQGYSVSCDNILLADKPLSSVRLNRQAMICDQGALYILMKLLEKLIPISRRIESLTGLVKKAIQFRSEEEKIMLRMGQAVLTHLFNLLYYSTINNPRNQIFVADSMPTLLAHVGSQPVASQCVTDMLASNMKLQQEKIGIREVTIFAKKLRDSRMNSMYLNLIRACCSCLGEGVNGNQMVVSQVVFHDVKDILITIYSDQLKKIDFDWGNRNNSLYIPYDNDDKLQPIYGSSLLSSDGFPQLSLLWTTTSIEMNPLSLFGKMSVPINELFSINGIPYDLEEKRGSTIGNGINGVNSTTNNELILTNSLENKMAIAEYFISELYLASDMCLGRNYIAMQVLEKLFSYEVLVSILQLQVNDSIKSAVVKLISRLYVDRDPQLKIVIPCLTRSWLQITKKESSSISLPCVEPERLNHFGLLQHIISKHLETMKNNTWDRLSVELMKLMNLLVEYNFYGTSDRLYDVINPLIMVLDRRKMDITSFNDMTMNNNNNPNQSSSSRKIKTRSSSLGVNSFKIKRLKSKNVRINSELSAGGPTTNNSNTGAAGASSGGIDNSSGHGMSQGAGDISTQNSKPMSGLEEEIFDDDVKNSWQKKVYDFLCDLPMLIFVILLVIVAVTTTVIEVVTGKTSDSLFIFGLIVTIIFCVELTLRYYCYVYIYKTFFKFFYSITNWIDIIVVAIDLIILGVPDLGGSGAEFAKILRVARLTRLIRIFRATRLVQKLKDLAARKYDEWKMPLRYLKTSHQELETMVQCVKILSHIQRIGEDRNISLLLNAFYNWEKGKDTRHPALILSDVIEESNQLSLKLVSNYDEILIDNLMFVYPELVQGVLDVLMSHYTRTQTLITNSFNIQLIISYKREKQRVEISNMLIKLERLIETNELWCDLKTSDDIEKFNETKEIFYTLLDMIRIKSQVLQFNIRYIPDTEIQNMLHNYGFYNIAFKILYFLSSSSNTFNEEDEDNNIGGNNNNNNNPNNNNNNNGNGIEQLIDIGLNWNRLESHQITPNHEIIVLCTELLYWFIYDNKHNQKLAYNSLNYFVENIDSKTGNEKIIQAIFVNNLDLMKVCPKTLISYFTELVCKNGRRPQYLSLLSSITNSGHFNILENQYEIVKQLIAPSKLEKMISYCVPINDVKYNEKIELMKPFLNLNDVLLEDLPQEIAYHIEFFRVLDGCSVGRSNITTIEAKVQSIIDYQDLLDALLDNNTLLCVKIQLGLYLYNAMIDVEIPIGALPQSNRLWKYLHTMIPIFENGMDSIHLIDKVGWEKSKVSYQQIEYVMVCCMIVSGFFTLCYDVQKLKSDENMEFNDRLSFTQTEINQLIIELFNKIKAIYELNSLIFKQDDKHYFIESLESLNRAVGKTLVIENIYDTQSNDNFFNNNNNNSTNHNNGEDNDDEDDDENNQVMIEKKIYKKYLEFLELIKSSEIVNELIKDESKEFVNYIENLPLINDNVQSDIRYEALITKLVTHVRDQLEITETEKKLSIQCTKTTIWIIKSFRTMIENKWKMSIYERDEDGGEEEDIAALPVITALNKCGATKLALDLICIGIDSNLVLESIKLCVAMLFLEGGNLVVQKEIHFHLSHTNSLFFFQQVRSILLKLIEWHETHRYEAIKQAKKIRTYDIDDNGNGNGDDNGNELELPEDIIVVRFLQLMCEGHFQSNQDIMREQPYNSTSVNLLDNFVSYFNCLSRISCRTSTDAAIRITATILEVIQGPCELNQDHFVLHTELIETINRVMRSTPCRNCNEEDEYELKKTCIDILQGLLEGQGGHSIVYERVLSVIHLDIIYMLCAPVQSDINTPTVTVTEKYLSGNFSLSPGTNGVVNLTNNITGPAISTPPSSSSLSPLSSSSSSKIKQKISPALFALQTESLVLLQMLCDYKPSLRIELNLDKDMMEKNSTVSSVEILWRGELQRRFFHIPDICADLAKASKDNLVENIDRRNLEIKLQDFVFRSRELYREIKHQQVLKEWYVSGIFSRGNQNTATWISFFLALIINLLMLFTYNAKDGTPDLPKEIGILVTALNIFQLVFATFTLILFLVVRVPVKYQSNISQGYSRIKAIILTGLDGLTLYYVVYVIFCLLAINYSDLFVTFLLLDIIIKDSTTRDVLYAVIYPRKQLAMTLILGLFVMYIFSFIIFWAFRDQMLAATTCDSLFSCFKVTLSYGVRSPGGIGDLMTHTLSTRYILDLLFFLIVLIVLLNIIFGIIIDTFGELRAKKLERQRDTVDKCLICGIDKQVFDRSSTVLNGFKTHIRSDHNMWNYLYFMIYIWEQDKDDDDGLEQYVRKCISVNDIQWFPMNKAMRLSKTKSIEENIRLNVTSKMKSVENELNSKLSDIQNDINETIDKIMILIHNNKGDDDPENDLGDGDGLGHDLLTMTGIDGMMMTNSNNNNNNNSGNNNGNNQMLTPHRSSSSSSVSVNLNQSQLQSQSQQNKHRSNSNSKRSTPPPVQISKGSGSSDADFVESKRSHSSYHSDDISIHDL